MMSSPALNSPNMEEPSVERPEVKPAENFYSTLKQTLQSYIRDSQPSIDNAAKLANISVRTLQRRLAESGLTYRDLLSQVRVETGKDLLRAKNRTVAEIAARLSYSDPSHFTRAFKRAVGLSPSAYQEKYSH